MVYLWVKSTTFFVMHRVNHQRLKKVLPFLFKKQICPSFGHLKALRVQNRSPHPFGWRCTLEPILDKSGFGA